MFIIINVILLKIMFTFETFVLGTWIIGIMIGAIIGAIGEYDKQCRDNSQTVDTVLNMCMTALFGALLGVYLVFPLFAFCL